MAQAMIIIGSLLVGGSGIFQLLKREPFKNEKNGKELSMPATITISIVCIIIGLAGVIYGVAMSYGV